jgi:hypothetical protein
LQLEEATIAKFEKTNLEDGLKFDMECDGHPHPLEKYIKAWRIQLWEHGFLGFFKSKESYSKTVAFGEHKHTDPVVKCVIFRYSFPWVPLHSHSLIQLHCDAHWLHFSSRYFTRELEPLGALQKDDLPLYLSTWLLKSFPHCMYTVGLLRSCSALHLKGGCWYLDYGKTLCLEDEEDVKKTCAQAEPKAVESGSINGNDHDGYEDEEEEDLSVLPEKERNKIEAKKKKDKEQLDEKKEKEALKAKGSKEMSKKGEKKAKEGEHKPKKVKRKQHQKL